MSAQPVAVTEGPKRKRRASNNVSLRIARGEITPAPGDLNFMTSLARGLAVIRVLNDTRADLTIAELSKMVGFPRASVRRCLHTLVLLGYVGFNLRDVGFNARAFFLKARP
jgi:IclR family pca regulon transcriptional regulator